MSETTSGYATVQAAAIACIDQLIKSEPPAWIDVLVQPQAEGAPYVSSGALEHAIVEESAKRIPPVVWASLRCELRTMQETVGTSLVVRGIPRPR